MTSQGEPDGNDIVRFGPFVLRPSSRQLLTGDTPVRLGSRALDILCLLVERCGEVVGRDEIIAKVWPNTFVIEGNLRVHITGLRRALGDGQGGQRYIVNVPNRGYAFVAPIHRHQPDRAAAPSDGTAPSPTPAPRGSSSLPAPLHRIIGRDEALQTLSEQVVQRRLVTVVGAGGVGKTTVAAS